jgi:hypothetical protein
LNKKLTNYESLEKPTIAEISVIKLTQLKNDNYTEADKDMLKNLDISNDVLNLRKFKKMVKTINLMTDKDDIDRHNTGKGKAEAEVNVSKVFNDRRDLRN